MVSDKQGIQYIKHIQYKNINFSVKHFDVCLFQLHDEILLKSNHLQELFFINIFPLDILNSERNQ